MGKLHGDDFHSISFQLYCLAWREAIYSTIDEAAKINSKANNPATGINSAVLELIKEGFFRDQAIAIRRIVEAQSINPRKSVVTLTSLLEDIEKNLHLITRENYISHDGLPFEYLPQKMKFMITAKNVSGSLPSAGRRAWMTSELLHKRFDKLSGVRSKRKRSRLDKINPKWLKKLKNRLTTSRDILAVKLFVNKFIAHSADPKNRTRTQLTLKKIIKCQRILYEISNCLSAQFLFGPTMASPLPTPQYDHLENIDKPWVDIDGKARLHDHWNRLSRRYDVWNYNLFSGR